MFSPTSERVIDTETTSAPAATAMAATTQARPATGVVRHPLRGGAAGRAHRGGQWRVQPRQIVGAPGGGDEYHVERQKRHPEIPVCPQLIGEEKSHQPIDSEHDARKPGEHQQFHGDARAAAVQRLRLARDDGRHAQLWPTVQLLPDQRRRRDQGRESQRPPRTAACRSRSRGPRLATATSNTRHSSIT